MPTSPAYPHVPTWLFYSIAILCAISLGISVFCVSKKDKIAYVDSIKLLSQYNGTIAAKTEYEKKMGGWKANIDTLSTELNNIVFKYQKEKIKLTEKERKLTEELINSKQQQLENYKNAIAQNAAKEDQEISGKVFKEINEFIKMYADAHGYDYILGATNSGNIVYAKNTLNITDEIIKELNAAYRKK